MRIVLGIFCALSIGAAPAPPAPASAPATRPARRRVIVNALVVQKPANPIPGVLAQQQAEAKIREIYASDYADASFTGRRTLALRLIEASESTRRDFDAKFVLLREARDLASGIGDITTAFDAIDKLAATFPVIKLNERLEVLKTAVPILGTVAANLAAASICMDLVDQSVVEGEYEHADVLLSLASVAARRGKSVPHFTWIESRGGSIRPLKDAYDVAKPFEKILKASPEEPEANLAVGKFVAFVKGDFDAGLMMLAKGADPALAKLADEDLDTPADRPSLQLKTARGWWEMSESASAELRAAMRRRAEFWYRKAAPGLDGLDKALAQRRLQELSPPMARSGTSKRPPDALKLTKHWYRASIADVTWETAQHLCAEAGGQLVSIETRGEGDLMTKLAHGRPLWLGGSVDPTTRHWSWLSGAEFFYTNWTPGEPTNFSPESHPITGPTGWKTCTARAGFICEWSE